VSYSKAVPKCTAALSLAAAGTAETSEAIVFSLLKRDDSVAEKFRGQQ
jgi:hypothetical protein